MANSISHAALPYPIKNARFTIAVPYLDADGDPTDPTTPDTELSQDGGAFADAAEEMTTISGSNGLGYITLTGAETNNSFVGLAAKVASGPKATLATLYPRNLAILGSGTLSAGSAGGGTLGTLLAYDVTGCFIRTTGGTGGGGTGGASNQARRIITYNTSTGAFTVSPNWETTPSTDTTYDVLLPEGVTLGMLKALNPTTAGMTLDVTATGEAGIDWANIGGKTTTNALTNTTISATQQVDVNTIKTQTVTCAAGVTVLASVGTAATSTAQTGDAYAVVNSGTFGNSAIKTLIDTGNSQTTAAAIRTALGLASANLDTQIATLATAATLAIVAGYIDTEIGTIITQTTAASIRSAVGLASANLDTQLDALPTNAELATALGTADDATLAAIAALSIPTAAAIATAVLTTQMTESYRATNAAPTLAQAQFELIAHMGESSISSTTKTLKKIDGSTTAKTYTLNDATTPTAITETT